LGPLEADYKIRPETTLSSLVQDIIQSRFLQFSSSHNRITGEVSGVEIVEIFSPHSPKPRSPEFKANPSACVTDVVGEKSLSFRFKHV
jgi:hypothetical protein